MSEIEPNTKKLAAIAYGEASNQNNSNEIGGIAFAFANRARAWNGKTIDELLQADPNYCYAVDGHNERYNQLISANSEQIAKNSGMSLALKWAIKALANQKPDPSRGAYWWDGEDFKKNYSTHPKVNDGFHFGSSSHNIFHVKEKRKHTIIYWKVQNRKTKKLVKSKIRGTYNYVWISTAAYGQTIFWLHDPNYLTATGGKAYR